MPHPVGSITAEVPDGWEAGSTENDAEFIDYKQSFTIHLFIGVGNDNEKPDGTARAQADAYRKGNTGLANNYRTMAEAASAQGSRRDGDTP